MKSLILIIAFLPFVVSGQDAKKTNKMILKASLLFASGFADGTAEVLRIDYSRFDKRFPGANDDFWDPNKSWVRKYKNGDPKQGEKFPLSTTALVWTTDGYHMARMFRNCTMVAGVVIPIGKKVTAKRLFIDCIIMYSAYTAGFNLSYEVFFKK